MKVIPALLLTLATASNNAAASKINPMVRGIGGVNEVDKNAKEPPHLQTTGFHETEWCRKDSNCVDEGATCVIPPPSTCGDLPNGSRGCCQLPGEGGAEALPHGIVEMDKVAKE